MVLAVMVVFLCFRVYQVVKPEEDKTGKIFRRAGNDLPPDVEKPGQPDLIADINYEERYDSLYTRNMMTYNPSGIRPGQETEGEVQVDLTVLSINEVSNGVFRAQIRTSQSRKWYSEGDAFESYELLSIDASTLCCDIFAENIGRRVTLCVE